MLKNLGDNLYVLVMCMGARAFIYDGRGKSDKLKYLFALTTMIMQGAVENTIISTREAAFGSNRAMRKHS